MSASINSIAIPAEAREHVGDFQADQPWLHVEYLPRRIVDVVVEPHGRAHERGARGPVEDAGAHQTLDDTIAEIKALRARLADYVAPENFLLIFSQRLEALTKLPVTCPVEPNALEKGTNAGQQVCSQQRNRCEESPTENRAVVLCYLSEPHRIEPFLRPEQQEAHRSGDCYEVTWPEFERIEQGLCGISKHVMSVGAAASGATRDPLADEKPLFSTIGREVAYIGTGLCLLLGLLALAGRLSELCGV